jgi:hypothetical protein
MYGPYSMRANKRGGWDVVRNQPTVVAESLKAAEAEALVFAMNAQVKTLESHGNKPKLDLRGWPDHLPPQD